MSEAQELLLAVLGGKSGEEQHTGFGVPGGKHAPGAEGNPCEGDEV